MSWPNSPNRAWFRLMSLELAAQLDAARAKALVNATLDTSATRIEVA